MHFISGDIDAPAVNSTGNVNNVINMSIKNNNITHKNNDSSENNNDILLLNSVNQNNSNSYLIDTMLSSSLNGKFGKKKNCITIHTANR